MCCIPFVQRNTTLFNRTQKTFLRRRKNKQLFIRDRRRLTCPVGCGLICHFAVGLARHELPTASRDNKQMDKAWEHPQICYTPRYVSTHIWGVVHDSTEVLWSLKYHFGHYSISWTFFFLFWFRFQIGQLPHGKIVALHTLAACKICSLFWAITFYSGLLRSILCYYVLLRIILGYHYSHYYVPSTGYCLNQNFPPLLITNPDKPVSPDSCRW